MVVAVVSFPFGDVLVSFPCDAVGVPYRIVEVMFTSSFGAVVVKLLTVSGCEVGVFPVSFVVALVSTFVA